MEIWQQHCKHFLGWPYMLQVTRRLISGKAHQHCKHFLGWPYMLQVTSYQKAYIWEDIPSSNSEHMWKICPEELAKSWVLINLQLLESLIAGLSCIMCGQRWGGYMAGLQHFHHLSQWTEHNPVCFISFLSFFVTLSGMMAAMRSWSHEFRYIYTQWAVQVSAMFVWQKMQAVFQQNLRNSAYSKLVDQMK
jgi:hypothetical protein